MTLTELERDEAFRYMGYHNGADIPDSIRSIAAECEKALLAVISPKFVFKVYDIIHTAEGVVVANTPLLLKGCDIAEHLKGCDKCIIFAATVSAQADAVIRRYEAAEQEKAFIADCLASAAVEQVCDMAEEEMRGALDKSGFYYTWRFSPGYGDLPLDLQGDILKILDANKRIGVTVTDSLILIPRKSVTAVIGLSQNEIPKGKRGCGSCNMRDRCSFRKRGAHCGS